MRAGSCKWRRRRTPCVPTPGRGDDVATSREVILADLRLTFRRCLCVRGRRHGCHLCLLPLCSLLRSLYSVKKEARE